jgi:LEA14-like dessication related protein
MINPVEIIKIDCDEDGKRNRTVIIHAEAGSHVEVTVNVKNFAYPEWFDQKMLDLVCTFLDLHPAK